MKRSRLKTRTPLRTRARLDRRARLERRSWMPRRRERPRREPRVRDEGYLDWVRTQRCAVADHPEHTCWGSVDPHHAGVKPGLRVKCDDVEAVPLCRRAHDDFEDHAGIFVGMSREERRTWQDQVIAETQARARRAGVLPQEETG